MSITTDKNAYFPGEPILVPAINIVTHLFVSPVEIDSKKMNWTPLEELRLGKYLAPERAGMYAVGTAEIGEPQVIGVIRVVETPVATASKVGIYTVAAAVIGIVGGAGILYYAYKKFKKS
jgi:hypothetical protein